MRDHACTSGGPCAVTADASAGSLAPAESDAAAPAGTGMAEVSFRTGRGGIFAHHWVEVKTTRGSYTLGFGPALIPLIDRGQLTVMDALGHVEWKYLLHPFSLHWNFARAPGVGRQVGKAIYLPVAQADRLLEKQRKRRFIFPYIPFFHDCRTYVCTIQASAQGKSRLPCYLLLKGYW